MPRNLTILITTCLLLFSLNAHAKRVGPFKVSPCVVNGIEYRVPHFGREHQKEQNGGFIQAWDTKTQTLLWDRMVYRILYNPDREKDTQDVFINWIEVINGKLIVTNEYREKFEMDLTTGAVRALTAVGEGRELPAVSGN